MDAADPPVVPDLVARRVRSLGAVGDAWLAELPDLVADLAARWGLRLGAGFDGGTASFVAEAVDRAGRACVLKVALPQGDDAVADFDRSVLVHRLAAGRGCVELLAVDRPSLAVLLERLGSNAHDAGLPPEALDDAVVGALLAFWRPVPDDVDLPTGAGKAAWLAELTTAAWDELGRPVDRRVVDRALACLAERAAAEDPRSSVLVHADPHGWNALRAGDGTWRLVDPEGLRAERAYDLGVLLREHGGPALAGDTPRLVRQRAERLGAACDVDPDAVWSWGFAERLSTGLVALRALGPEQAEPLLEVARRCA